MKTDSLEVVNERRVLMDLELGQLMNTTSKTHKLVGYIVKKLGEVMSNEFNVQMTKVSKEIGVDLKTANAHLKELENLGVITTYKKKGKNGGTLISVNPNLVSFVGGTKKDTRLDDVIKCENTTNILGHELPLYKRGLVYLFDVVDISNWIGTKNPVSLLKGVSPEDIVYREFRKELKYLREYYVTEKGVYQILAKSKKTKKMGIKDKATWILNELVRGRELSDVRDLNGYVDERDLYLTPTYTISIGVKSLNVFVKHNEIMFLVREIGDVLGYVESHLLTKKVKKEDVVSGHIKDKSGQRRQVLFFTYNGAIEVANKSNKHSKYEVLEHLYSVKIQ
ncbi:hypothetical protein vBBceHLY2_00195 [Bacillus phage vB_BceH_LY2]|nr:hypothetical protein vBBceHLY2_00195 [Bacillus phage vB_BceH_LY2]